MPHPRCGSASTKERWPLIFSCPSLLGQVVGYVKYNIATDVRSTDWQSLTFVGERHEFSLRIPGRDSPSVVEQMCAGLEDAEFSIPGQIVADIAVLGQPTRGCDGSTSITIEALTVGE